MIRGIQMTEQSMETKIAVLEAKVDHMMGHTKELTLRVRANEKVVASVSLLGVIACTIIGAGYFAPKADATPTAGEWIQSLRDHEAEKNRTPIDETLNSALILEDDYGCDGSTKSEELLQLPSDQDQQGDRRRHDRRDPGPWVQSDEEGEGQDCRCGYTREEDEGFRGEGTWD